MTVIALPPIIPKIFHFHGQLKQYKMVGVACTNRPPTTKIKDCNSTPSSTNFGARLSESKHRARSFIEKGYEEFTNLFKGCGCSDPPICILDPLSTMHLFWVLGFLLLFV